MRSGYVSRLNSLAMCLMVSISAYQRMHQRVVTGGALDREVAVWCILVVYGAAEGPFVELDHHDVRVIFGEPFLECGSIFLDVLILALIEPAVIEVDQGDLSSFPHGLDSGANVGGHSGSSV